ncbi:acyl-CoA dehydrogenase family protein, partial [Salmonella enterica subsp. enterica serovar Anatum]|nr:acyl-CoA dehydrogenase family protein [Salmonella enterica subsp. enterica serovar Anatum]
MLLEAAWKADNGTITSGDAAMCKYFCANAAFEVVDTAMQVLGDDNASANRVEISINTQIKLIYRPPALTKSTPDSQSQQLKWQT